MKPPVERYTKSQPCSDHIACTQACNALLTRLTHNLCKQYERPIANDVKDNAEAFWKK